MKVPVNVARSPSEKASIEGGRVVLDIYERALRERLEALRGQLESGTFAGADWSIHAARLIGSIAEVKHLIQMLPRD